jgi:hypothetical protein
MRGKEVSRMKNPARGAEGLLWGTILAVAAAGCTPKPVHLAVENLRPRVELTARPQPGDSVYFKVHLQWNGSDADGRVDYFVYAVDPPLEGDTAWTRIDRNETTIFFRSSVPSPGQIEPPFPASQVISKDFHGFVIKAVDNEGAFSAPASVDFDSRTVAPVTVITSPSPNRMGPRSTAPSVRIEWRGTDPDREGEGVAGPPRLYKYKLVSQTVIQQTLGLGSVVPNQEKIQEFFMRDGHPPDFAGWDSVSADTAFKQFEGVTPGQVWYFAVVSFDIAGAYEPRFNLEGNVLAFRPSTELQAPAITVFNSFFTRTQTPRGSFDLSESRVVHLEVPEGQPIPMHWVVQDQGLAPGTFLAGYRWVLDPIDGDIFNETPRQDDSQTYRWSSWSTTETSTILGPFSVTGKPDSTFHRFYIEARDNTGAVSIMVIQLEVVKAQFKDPSLARNILFFDDYRGVGDRPDHQPFSAFPIESALDTLFYARGGFPYTGMPAGTLSKPGIFSGYFSDAAGNVVSDTIDYRFAPSSGLPLSVLTRYRAVVWYTGATDAGGTGSHFSPKPEAALRYINDPGQLNTLAVYLSQGGKAFLFGGGILKSIALGYAARFPGNGPLGYPFRGEGTGPDRDHILWPGNFLYDYMKIQQGADIVDIGGDGDNASSDDNYIDFIPYLPQFRCEGAPWPPDGWTGQRTATCDPRVGPASVRNLPTWDGLPILPMQTEFNSWPTLPNQSLVVFYLGLATSIPTSEAEFDTLYLGRCIKQKIRAAADWPDGKPVWFHVTDHTGQGWELDWCDIPLWFLDRTHVQIAVGKVLGKFGFTKNTNPRTQIGPGGVDLRPVGVAQTARASTDKTPFLADH